MQGIHLGEKIFIGGDSNDMYANTYQGHETVHDGFCFGSQNDAGKSILDFAGSFDLRSMSTFFKKRDEHLITFQSGSSKSKLVFFLMIDVDRLVRKDYKVISVVFGVTS